ncbi:MAG TPA: TolC family protein [Prolixibacteraceae bacterium]|nr:TolC family protein [Prolixibacteraceae bacterium]
MIKNILSAIILVAFVFGKIQAQSLDIYINSALKNSPLLYDYNNQMLAGRLDSLLILAAFKPQVNQVSQVLYPPAGSGWGYDESITNGGNYSAVVNVTQSLFNKKHINGQLQSIGLLNQTLKINARITVIDLKKSITAQYLTAYTDFMQYQFNQSVLARLTDEQRTVKVLVDKGVYLMTDYLNLQVLTTAQKIAISQSFIQLKNDLAVLNFICGVTDQQEINLIKPEIIVQNDPGYESSPMFAQFRIDSLKNTNNKQIIDLNYRPRLSAFADAGFNSIAPENIPHNFGGSFGVNFSIPIYDGKQRKLQYDKINLAENTRIYYKKYYSSQYKLQFEQLTNQLKLTENLIGEISNQLSEQEKLIDLYQIELEKGLVRFLDYLTVLNNYTATKNTFLVTEMNRLQIINQLNYLK